MSPTSNSVSKITPQLSLRLLNYARSDVGDWQYLLNRARAADEAGIDRLIVSDHIVFGENLEAYGRPDLGGIHGGKQPTGSDGHWLEPLTVLAVIAGITTRVRLSTGILIAALRRPAVLAKTVATLDVLSGGRVDLGVGIGWQREEYEACGLDFEKRGYLLDNTLAVCQTLWREGPVSFESHELNFRSLHCAPRPVQFGGVPIWLSGTLNHRVLNRLTRFGSGWIPWGSDAEHLVDGVAKVRQALASAGRETDGFQIRGNLPMKWNVRDRMTIGRSMSDVPRLVEAGITDFCLTYPLPEIPQASVSDDPSAELDLLSTIVSAFRKAVGRTA